MDRRERGPQPRLRPKEDVALDERRRALEGEDTALGEPRPAIPVEVGAVERLAGALGIGAVEEDHVEGLQVPAGDIGRAVADDQLEARILPRRSDRAEVTLAGLDDLAVDLDHHQRLDAGVAEHLAGGPTVAAADQQHAPGRPRADHRRVDHLLVIEGLSALGGVENPVEAENSAEDRAVEDVDPLKLTVAAVKPLFDPQADAKGVAIRLLEPVV